MKFLWCILINLCAAMGAVAAADELGKVPGLNDPDYWELQPETFDRSFHICVRLPEGYASSDKDCPAIYVLDGGFAFAMLSGYHNYLVSGEEVPDAIVVGVAYGDDTISEGNFRTTDFTAPAAGRDDYGGAPAFQRTFETQLRPLMESEYRADPNRRILFGQPLGEQCVL